jgi:hypothetical protein
MIPTSQCPGLAAFRAGRPSRNGSGKLQVHHLEGNYGEVDSVIAHGRDHCLHISLHGYMGASHPEGTFLLVHWGPLFGTGFKWTRADGDTWPCGSESVNPEAVQSAVEFIDTREWKLNFQIPLKMNDKLPRGFAFVLLSEHMSRGTWWQKTGPILGRHDCIVRLPETSVPPSPSPSSSILAASEGWEFIHQNNGCFLTNTVFKLSGGDFSLATQLQEGNRVQVATTSGFTSVIEKRDIERGPCEIRTIGVRNGASLSTSLDHWWLVRPKGSHSDEKKQSSGVRKGDSILVGQVWKTVTSIADRPDNVGLVRLRFDPDIPVLGWILPDGIATYGSEPEGVPPTAPDTILLMEAFRNVPQEDLERAQPVMYED